MKYKKITIAAPPSSPSVFSPSWHWAHTVFLEQGGLKRSSCQVSGLRDVCHHHHHHHPRHSCHHHHHHNHHRQCFQHVQIKRWRRHRWQMCANNSRQTASALTMYPPDPRKGLHKYLKLFTTYFMVLTIEIFYNILSQKKCLAILPKKISNLSDEAFFGNCRWSFISFFMKRFFLSDIWEFLCQARHGFKEHWECSVNDSEWRRLWISSRTRKWIGLWTRRWLRSQTSKWLKWTLILQFWECFVDY